jgi:hypothetical protein
MALTAAGTAPPYAEAIAPSQFDEILLLASEIIAINDAQQARAGASDLVRAVETYLEPVGDRAGSFPLAVPPSTETLELLDVRSGRFEDQGGEDLLILAKSGTISHVNSGIVIADGSLQISHTQGSLIVATGGVNISHSSENVIFAGYYAALGFDGLSRPRGWRIGDPEFRARSTVISGNLVVIGHAKGSLISAPGQIAVTHLSDVLCVNSAPVAASKGASRALTLESMAFARREFIELLRDVTVLHVPYTEQENGMLLTIAAEEEFRMHFGEPIEALDGPHTRVLAGWTPVLYLGDRLIFEREGRYALVRTEEKPPDPIMLVIMVALTIAVLVLWAGSRLKG